MITTEAQPENRMRVVLADDAVLLREGVRSLLEDEGISVVASVGDGGELLRAVAELRPTLAIVDVRMPPTHTTEGLEAALAIKRRFPDIGVLVLSQYVLREYATPTGSAGPGHPAVVLLRADVCPGCGARRADRTRTRRSLHSAGRPGSPREPR